MSRKILFFLSSDSFRAHVWKSGALTSAYNFSNNAEGKEQFADFLQTHHDPAYLLVDLIEEDFRQETVPHLTGANHQALLQRKYDQYYRSTTFRMARLQQRQTEGRRDDELLFSGLTNPALITPWLELMLQHKTPIVGVYSVPHTSAPLIKDIHSDHLLLLSWEKDAGLRQSYFLNKRLRFSRLTPIQPNTSFAEAIVTESARTNQYLQSLSLAPQGQLLDVHIICHTDDRAQLDEHLTSNEQLQYAYINLQLQAKNLKSKYDYTDSDATPLFLHLLATQTPRANYASSLHTHYYQLWQTQRVLFVLAAATAIVSIVWSTLSFNEGNEIETETAAFTSQSSRMMQQAHQIIQQFPDGTASSANGNNGTASASDMKTAVTMFRRLQFYSVPPQQILNGLTRTLDNFPRIRTIKLGWQMADVPGVGASGNAPAQVLTFDGELDDFGNDYRGAINYLERFQLVLVRAGYAVTPVKLPLDFSSKGSISADISDNSIKSSAFSLKLIWRPQE